eukprot:352940-Alexandrium_andersonii.AAC.1
MAWVCQCSVAFGHTPGHQRPRSFAVSNADAEARSPAQASCGAEPAESAQQPPPRPGLREFSSAGE